LGVKYPIQTLYALASQLPGPSFGAVWRFPTFLLPQTLESSALNQVLTAATPSTTILLTVKDGAGNRVYMAGLPEAGNAFAFYMHYLFNDSPTPPLPNQLAFDEGFPASSLLTTVSIAPNITIPANGIVEISMDAVNFSGGNGSPGRAQIVYRDARAALLI
jgi:hypothetical protein